MVRKFAKYFKAPFICMNKIHMLFPITSRSITNTVCDYKVVLLIHYWKEKMEEKLLGNIKKQSKKPLV